MKTRGLVIVVAVVLAGVATGAVFLYVRGLQGEAQAEQEMVSVVVAKQDIPPGTQLDQMLSGGMFTTTTLPRTSLIRGVVTTLTQLQGQETSSPILAGEQISTARLRGQAEFGGGILGIPEGHKAVTLPMEAHQAIGGAVRVGDHVSIYGTFDTAGKLKVDVTTEQTSTGGTARGVVEAVPGLTVTVVPDVQVLQVSGGSAESSSLGTSASGSSSEERIMVTLALQPQDAQRVIFAMERGRVWLGLLPPNEAGAPEAPVSFLEVAR